MARKKINPRRQKLVEWIEAHGEVVEDESMRELEVLADIMGMNNEVPIEEESTEPGRKRERPEVIFTIVCPELITMFQGAHTRKLENTHKIRKHARDIHENNPVTRFNGLIHTLRNKKHYGRNS